MTKTINLMNVAIKVQRQHKHDCIISIGRLNYVEKDELLNMYPLAIQGLQCKNHTHFFQMTIDVRLPDLPDFKICDSDACCLTITDRAITRITQPNYTGTLCLANWFGSSDSETSNDESNSKEENKLRIDLENVAVKVEHQNPNDYCVISIGRLNHSEKCRLLNMFPTAIGSLKCVSQYPGYPLYQMTVSACLPDLPDFKICDSDVCNISIMDRMITSQTEPSDKNMCKRNWFGSDDSDSNKSETDTKVNCTRLLFVAVKVDNKRGKYKYIRIGRIGEMEKKLLEQMMPSSMLNFKTKTIVTVTRSMNYYELDLPAITTDIVDSNYCAISISYDERNPNVVSISDQRFIENRITPQWFLSIAQRLAPPRISIPDTLVKPARQVIDQNKKEETNMNTVSLEKCIINDNATIFFWSDGTKTVTKTTPGDAFDPEVGIAMGIAKRLFGSKHKFDKFVNAVVSDMYKRNAAAFTEKELLDALAENEKIITKAKAKHNAEKAAYITAKNDPNHEGKLPELHSLKGDHFYRFAKIRKDIIMAEIEKRKAKKAAKAKAKAAKAKKKSDK